MVIGLLPDALDEEVPVATRRREQAKEIVTIRETAQRNGIKFVPTNRSETQGRHLVITTEKGMERAEKLIDKVFQMFYGDDGMPQKLRFPEGTPRRENRRIVSQDMFAYAQALQTESDLREEQSDDELPSVWRRSSRRNKKKAQSVFDLSEFPELPTAKNKSNKKKAWATTEQPATRTQATAEESTDSDADRETTVRKDNVSATGNSSLQ